MVDYNNFSKTFSSSRKNMKWEEIDYFLSFLEWKKGFSILDIWCGNGRLLSHLKDKDISYKDYLWVDLSEWLLEEASLIHPEARFLHLNMLDIDKVSDKFDYVFMIASFHHLDTLEKRKQFLDKLKNVLNKNSTIFMTNWSLESKLNKEKYNTSKIKDSENEFWWKDFDIKIWEFSRYYHCFSIEELEYLFNNSNFEIIENREFENNRNFISIIK